MASKVYFLNDRAGSIAESTPFKGVKVLRDAGIEKLFKKGDRVGIKLHMGEWGNSLNLRPHWVGAVVNEVKRLGGDPVLFDSAMVPGSENSSRSTKVDHLKTAAFHGFHESTVGCPIIICDGDYGVDDVQVDVPSGVYMKHTFMGKDILDFDAIIVVSHFKGHVMGVFGGALKNVGIGMASARGKIAIHYLSSPQIGFKTWELNPDFVKTAAQAPHPNYIDNVVANCPFDCFTLEGDDVLTRDKAKCKQCGYCFTPLFAGLYQMPQNLIPTWAPAISDSAAGFINKVGKDNMLFLNYAMDITPGCDCNSFHDRAMVPNVGMFASKDPVALDMACIEAAEALVAVPGSVADEYGFTEPGTERFTNCSSMAKMSQWSQINAAVHNGIGTSEYTLVNSVPGEGPEYWFPRYSPDNSFFAVNKEAYSHYDMDPGDYSYDVNSPNMSIEELSAKPKGKKEEISI